MRLPVVQFTSKFSTWNLRIKETSSNKRWEQVLSCYQEMKESEIQLTGPSVFPLILKACSNLSLKLGKSMHGCLIKKGFDSFASIGNSIIDFYMKWGVLDSALGAFDCLENRDSVSWNIMVYGNLIFLGPLEGLSWFKKARFDNFQPNNSTLVLVFQACRDLKAYHEGSVLHGYVIQSGFSAIVSVQNSLLSLYSDVNVDCTRKLFDEMSERDIISWSVMIGGYVQCEKAEVGLQIFQEMISEVGIKPDGVILVTILKACAFLGNITMGTIIHGLVIFRGFEYDLFVGNSLIDVYSKCNRTDSAFKVFEVMPIKNIVSWNCMLSAYVLNEKHSEAVSLLYSMEKQEIEADELTLVNILQTCKHFVHGLQCKSVHCRTIRRGYELNEKVVNSLIDAYAKCNLVKLASTLFYGMDTRDVVSWSTMIAGFTCCGKPDEAMAVFRKMNQVKVKPNEITIINLLKACAVSASLTRSKWAHAVVIRRGFDTDVLVGTALIDMYSNCGEIEDSKRVFNQIPEKNLVSWSAMIAAYGINGLAQQALDLLGKMKQNGVNPNAVTALSILSACSHGGLVEEGLSFFKSMVLEHRPEPSLEHYSCLVDMLGRAGKLESALELIKNMPKEIEDKASVWGALSSSCRNNGNSILGTRAVSRVLELEPLNSAGYMIASNLYAVSGLMDDAVRMRKLANERGVKIVAGYSLVHVGDRVCRFVAGDETHRQANDINSMVVQLHGCMKIKNENSFGVVEC